MTPTSNPLSQRQSSTRAANRRRPASASRARRRAGEDTLRGRSARRLPPLPGKGSLRPSCAVPRQGAAPQGCCPEHAGYRSARHSLSRPPRTGDLPQAPTTASPGFVFAPSPRPAGSLRKSTRNRRLFLNDFTRLSKPIGLRSGDQNSPSSAARVSKMALQVFSKRAALFCASPFFTQCR